jgi:hypothetical protein
MIETHFFDNYKGPTMIKATLDGRDILYSIQTYYGTDRNWKKKLWTYTELFGEYSLGKQIYLEFENEQGTKFWSYNRVLDTSQLYNPKKLKLT